MKELNLESGERIGLIFGSLTLLMVVALLVYIPSGPRKQYELARQDLNNAHQELRNAKLIKLSEEQRLLQQEQLMERLESRDAGFDFMAFMDRRLRDADLVTRAQLSYLPRARNTPDNQPMVQLRLEGVALTELIDFLYAVYDSKNLVALHRMDVKPAANNRGLSCTLTFVTITRT